MLIPLKYNVRYLMNRWAGTLVTAMTFGLVVGVFVMIMTLVTGLRSALTTTADPLNVMVMRKGVMAEGQSVVTRDQYHAIQDLPGIATDAKGNRLVVPEVLTLVNKPRASDGQSSNIQLRGVAPLAFELRPMVKIVEGRNFKPGLREIIVAKSVAERFVGFDLGEKVHMGRGDWTVVGLFEAGKTAYNSEAWMDYNEMMQEFDRSEYNTAVLHAVDKAAVVSLKKLVETEGRIQLVAKAEQEYYDSQTSAGTPLEYFGAFLATMMAIGASFAGMNTMYANVAGRVREIGTLRILGFHRTSILSSFLLESIVLSFFGGILGCLAAQGLGLLLARAPIGTSNFQTFSEVVFYFRVTPQLMGYGMIFAMAMGLFGGLLPAIQAARIPILKAMRQT